MEAIRSVEDFKKFLKDNRELVKANTIRIQDLPKDDPWAQDDKWDEIYEKGEKRACQSTKSVTYGGYVILSKKSKKKSTDLR